MLSFNQYLTETTKPGGHMDHIEDSILLYGIEGARRSIIYLSQLGGMFAGTAKSKVNLSAKFDGAPSIFAGIDPTDGKFFVAKKGIFNVTPELYKTPEDINTYLQGDLAAKFHIALQYLPELGIKGIIQGDFLFVKSDLKDLEYNGEDYITFHPNTLVYAVPKKSALAKVILSAKVGVVWHTSYIGKDLKAMKATFNQPIVPKLKNSKNVWAIDAAYKDITGHVTFTADEQEKYKNLISSMGSTLRSIKSTSTKTIQGNNELYLRMATFNNQHIRNGKLFTNHGNYFSDLVNYIWEYYEKEKGKVKSSISKDKVDAKRKHILNDLVHIIGEEQINNIMRFMDLAVQAKVIVIAKLNTLNSMHTFLKTVDGYRVTDYEGFVASDHLGKNAVKLVDRLTFSMANFSPNIQKGWERRSA